MGASAVLPSPSPCSRPDPKSLPVRACDGQLCTRCPTWGVMCVRTWLWALKPIPVAGPCPQPHCEVVYTSHPGSTRWRRLSLATEDRRGDLSQSRGRPGPAPNASKAVLGREGHTQRLSLPAPSCPTPDFRRSQPLRGRAVLGSPGATNRETRGSRSLSSPHALPREGTGATGGRAPEGQQQGGPKPHECLQQQPELQAPVSPSESGVPALPGRLGSGAD